MTALKFSVVLALASYVLAGHVSNSTCPSTGLSVTCSSDKVSYCVSDSLKSNIIVRCEDTSNGLCPTAGNCNDNLAGVPPVGVKTGAVCYQDNAWAGNAQCVYNCVLATKLDGKKFYPVGCTSASSSVAPSTSVTASTTLSSTHGHPESSSSPYHSKSSPSSGHHSHYPHSSYIWGNGTHSHHSHTGTGSHTKHHTKTYSTTYTSTSSHTGSVYTTSSTTYFTTTLPNGATSTGSSVVSFTTTTSGPELSNNAAGYNANGVLGLAIAGLLALV